jgi:hypothetical protein
MGLTCLENMKNYWTDWAKKLILVFVYQYAIVVVPVLTCTVVSDY